MAQFMPLGPEPDTSTTAVLWSESSEDAMSPSSPVMLSTPTFTGVSVIPTGTASEDGRSRGVM